MEFVSPDEVKELLDSHQIREVVEGEDSIRLQMDDADGAVHLHLKSEASEAEAREGAQVCGVAADKIGEIVEQVLHTLHVTEVLLIPIGKWRRVFDAVAFSLAENEEWQRIDAAATVELNSRDPLVCEPSDYHTLSALIGALVSDAEEPDQGFAILPPAAPVLLEIVPDGAVRVSLGNQVLADEVSGVVAS